MSRPANTPDAVRSALAEVRGALRLALSMLDSIPEDGAAEHVDRLAAGMLELSDRLRLALEDRGANRPAVRAVDLEADVLAWQASGLARGLNPRYLRQGRNRIMGAAKAQGWATAQDITGRAIEEWLAAHTSSGANYNRILGYFSAFLEWAKRSERVRENAARRVLKARELGGGLTTRAFSPAEASQIIDYARRDGQDPKSKRKARNRWIVYLTAWHTGLRRSEIRSITVAMLAMRDSPPRIVLGARVAKARKTQTVPLHPDLVEPLRELAKGKEPHHKLFPFVRDEVVIDDIIRAGVPREVDGMTTGMHSFRKGLATELARRNVPEAVAQALLRHSDPKLTRNVYTDARLLPLAAAMAQVSSVDGSEDGS